HFALSNDPEERECDYFGSPRLPHISLMVVRGRLARVEVDAEGVPSEAGLQVGDSEANAKKRYGAKLKVMPRAYIPETGHYLTVRDSTGQYGIRYETENGKITRFYAGKYSAIQYIEGCQ